MTYTVIWTAKSLKGLKQLHHKTALRIVTVVEKIRDDPLTHLQQLRSSPYFKLRVGKYRVIVDLEKEAMIIYILKVGKRGNVYNAI